MAYVLVSRQDIKTFPVFLIKLPSTNKERLLAIGRSVCARASQWGLVCWRWLRMVIRCRFFCFNSSLALSNWLVSFSISFLFLPEDLVSLSSILNFFKLNENKDRNCWSSPACLKYRVNTDPPFPRVPLGQSENRFPWILDRGINFRVGFGEFVRIRYFYVNWE